MSTRKTFLKQSILASALLVPAGRAEAVPVPGKARPVRSHKPLFVSTWRHGLEANARAWDVLHTTGSVVDAVEEGVKVTEADLSNRSVGLAGHPDREGIVTLDASIMQGDGACGSVCFVRQIRHPITLARKVMENTPHVMLAGEGARRFAIAEGMPLEEESLHPDAERAYKKWLLEKKYQPVINIENHDTIGLVGIDANGTLAGSCTTSGLAYKMHGRVGDSPIIGAGLFADNDVGAATATGLGESIIRVSGSFLVVELMRQGRSPEEACREVIDRLIAKNRKHIENTQAGFIAINKDGDYGGFVVRRGFNFAVHHAGGFGMEDAGFRL